MSRYNCTTKKVALSPSLLAILRDWSMKLTKVVAGQFSTSSGLCKPRSNNATIPLCAAGAVWTRNIHPTRAQFLCREAGLRYDGPFVEEAGGAGFMPADRKSGWIAAAPLTSARSRCFALGHLHLCAKAIDGVAKCGCVKSSASFQAATSSACCLARARFPSSLLLSDFTGGLR
jgi:hypothetical protein